MAGFLVWADDVLLYVQAEPGFQYEHCEGNNGWERARSQTYYREREILYTEA